MATPEGGERRGIRAAGGPGRLVPALGAVPTLRTMPRRLLRGAGQLPGVLLVRHYRRADLRPDLVAAVTVTAVLVPSGLAYGELAGLPPVAGLYTACLGMVCFALFTTSRVVIVGPESQTAILVAATLAPLAAGDPERYAALAAALALVCAGVFLAAAVLRLGFLANYVSRPVLVGYLSGVALTIITSQLATLVGASTGGDTLVALAAGLWRHRDEADAASAVVGTVTIAIIVGLRVVAPRVPAALVAVVGLTAASALLGLAEAGVAVVGEVPRGLPAPAVPLPAVDDLLALLWPAAGLSLLVFADSVVSARAYAQRRDEPRISSDAELVALGAANAGAGLCQGFPAGASASRTSVNDATGGRTQLVGVLAAGFTLGFLLVLTPLVRDLPTPVLAGVVIVAAWRLLRPGEIRQLYRFRPFEALLAVATIVGVAVVGILPGILLAVAATLVELIHRLSNPAAAVLGPVARSSRWRAVPAELAAAAEPRLLVVRYGAPLLFANVELVTRHVQRQLRSRPEGVDWLVVDAEAMTSMDSTGAQGLAALLDLAQRRGITFALARVTQPLTTALRRAGLWERIGEQHVYDRVEDAVAAYRAARDGS